MRMRSSIQFALKRTVGGGMMVKYPRLHHAFDAIPFGHWQKTLALIKRIESRVVGQF